MPGLVCFLTWSPRVFWGEPAAARGKDAEAETVRHTRLETANPEEWHTETLLLNRLYKQKPIWDREYVKTASEVACETETTASLGWILLVTYYFTMKHVSLL